MSTPDHPKSETSWRLSDASYDLKLVSFYLGGMILLFVGGRAMLVGMQLMVTVVGP